MKIFEQPDKHEKSSPQAQIGPQLPPRKQAQVKVEHELTEAHDKHIYDQGTNFRWIKENWYFSC